VEANILMLDFDVSTFNGGAHYIEQALSTYQPVVSAPIRFFPGAPMEDEQNSILLFHPGIPLESRPDLNPKGLALLVINMKSVIDHMLDGMVEDTVAIYIYEYSHLEENTHTFMIGVDLSQDRLDEASFYLEPIGVKQLQEESGNKLIEIEYLPIASTTWTLAVVALDREYKATYASVIVG
jgi:hypothetical protein